MKTGAMNNSQGRSDSPSQRKFGSGSMFDFSSAREEEKTIPFLRRLVDMLQENSDVISFARGCEREGQLRHGQIIVHDRTKMESSVLPRYFNHSSFASLRRQLNYFSFTRVGKGRQRGATYSNASVVELDDILRLKRRTSVGGGSGSSSSNSATNASASTKSASKRNSISTASTTTSISTATATANPVTTQERTPNMFSSPAPTSFGANLVGTSSTVKHVGDRATPKNVARGPSSVSRKISYAEANEGARSHLPPKKRARHTGTTGSHPVLVSPQFSPTKNRNKTAGLDLTVASPQRCSSHFGSRFAYRGDDDILAGCNALLSFSRSLSAM